MDNIFQIGADVPFFFHQKPAIINGVHQTIVETSPPKIAGILCFPRNGISTKKIYSHFNVPLEKNYDLQNIPKFINSYVDFFYQTGIKFDKKNLDMNTQDNHKFTNSIVSHNHYLENDFMHIIAKKYPTLHTQIIYYMDTIKSKLQEQIQLLIPSRSMQKQKAGQKADIEQFCYCSLSGSGSSFYVFFDWSSFVKIVPFSKVHQSNTRSYNKNAR